jgi:excisionase family DNA binding protein
MSDFYTLDEVAKIVGVHIRTVRNFVRDGRLPATRIGKQYRVAAEDLSKLTGQPATAYRPDGRHRHVETSAVVEIDAIDRDTSQRITTMVMAAAGSRSEGPPLRIQTSYDETRARLKVMVMGGIDDTVALLKAVNALAEP